MIKKTQVTAENQIRKATKKMVEQYQEILAVPETGKILLFKCNRYKSFVSIWLESLCMHPVICDFDNGAGSNLVRGDVLDQT